MMEVGAPGAEDVDRHGRVWSRGDTSYFSVGKSILNAE